MVNMCDFFLQHNRVKVHFFVVYFAGLKSREICTICLRADR